MFLPTAPPRMHPTLRIACLLIAASACLPAASRAAPHIPGHDGEIVETLPALLGWSRNQRQAQRELLARPQNLPLALQTARAYLELARNQGDARYAGQALGALQAWQPMSAATPNAVLVMHATVSQFLHDFDGAERTLKLAMAQPSAPPQGWLTLATILRVRGRYSESDSACRKLAPLGQPLYGAACLAENAGLRGQHAAARTELAALLQDPAVQGPAQASVRQWLWTTVAEVEELAGRPAAAEAAYRQALASGQSGYDAIAYSDFLLLQDRPAEVAPLLADQPRSDAVLLRRVIAAKRLDARGTLDAAQRTSAHTDQQELAARFDASAERPGATVAHARELALFALDVQGDPARAVALARIGVGLQREPTDLLILARAAVAADDAAARAELRALQKSMGLRDARIDGVR